MGRTPPAIQRSGVSGGLEKRAGLILRPQGGFGNLTFSTNGPDFRVRGVEIQLVARVMEGLTVQGSASWNSSNQTNSPFLINNNPKSSTYGQPITSVANPYGTVGSPLANSPPFQANLRARYEFPIGDYRAFFQAGGTHQGNSYSATGNVALLRSAGVYPL